MNVSGQDPFSLSVRADPRRDLRISRPASARVADAGYSRSGVACVATMEAGGIVGAAGRVDYFQRFYREGYPDPGTRVSLLNRMAPCWPAIRPPRLRSAKVVAWIGSCLAATRQRGDHAAIPQPDRWGRCFVAIRRVQGYPLAVAVSREADAALAAWRSQAPPRRTLARSPGLAAGLLVAVGRQLRIVWRWPARTRESPATRWRGWFR